MGALKGSRTLNDILVVSELTQLLTPFARLNDCDWDWVFFQSLTRVEEVRAQAEPA